MDAGWTVLFWKKKEEIDGNFNLGDFGDCDFDWDFWIFCGFENRKKRSRKSRSRKSRKNRVAKYDENRFDRVE